MVTITPVKSGAAVGRLTVVLPTDRHFLGNEGSRHATSMHSL